jgi:hypothetical protein
MIAAKVGGLVPEKKGGIRAITPGIFFSIVALAASLTRMSISGLWTEKGAARIGQSSKGLAEAGAAAKATAKDKHHPKIERKFFMTYVLF